MSPLSVRIVRPYELPCTKSIMGIKTLKIVKHSFEYFCNTFSLHFQIVNRGHTTVSFSALPSLEMLQRCSIDVLPAAEVLLRPRESTDLTFFYK